MSSLLTLPTNKEEAKQKYNKDNNNPPSKNNAEVGTLPGSPIGFIVSIIGQIFYIALIVSIGSIMLHYCRVAQSNVLPSCGDNVPYTYKPVLLAEAFDEKTGVFTNDTSLIDMNIVKNTPLGDLSTKIYFSYGNNTFQDKWPFRPLFNMVYGANANIISRYIALTIQGCLFLNITMINTFFNFINSCCSETVIIFIVPIVFMFSIIPLFIFNGVYLLLMYLYNVILLKDASITPAQGLPEKVKQDWSITPLISIWSILTIYCGLWGFLIVFILLFGWAFAGITGIIIAIYSFILPLLIKANVVEKQDNTYVKSEKFYTIGDTFWDIWKYKMSFIMYVISFMVVSGASSAYGLYTGFCVFICCILLYHFTTVYDRYIPIIKDASGKLQLSDPSISKTNLLAVQVEKNCDKIIQAIDIKDSNAMIVSKDATPQNPIPTTAPSERGAAEETRGATEETRGTEQPGDQPQVGGKKTRKQYKQN